MEAANTSETSVNFHYTIQRYNSEHRHLHSGPRKDLKSYQKDYSRKFNNVFKNREILHGTDEERQCAASSPQTRCCSCQMQTQDKWLSSFTSTDCPLERRATGMFICFESLCLQHTTQLSPVAWVSFSDARDSLSVLLTYSVPRIIKDKTKSSDIETESSAFAFLAEKSKEAVNNDWLLPQTYSINLTWLPHYSQKSPWVFSCSHCVCFCLSDSNGSMVSFSHRPAHQLVHL
jgi:hypothetical protein